MPYDGGLPNTSFSHDRTVASSGCDFYMKIVLVLQDAAGVGAAQRILKAQTRNPKFSTTRTGSFTFASHR